MWWSYFILSDFLTEQEDEFCELRKDMEAAHQRLEKVTVDVETTPRVLLSDEPSQSLAVGSNTCCVKRSTYKIVLIES